MIKLLRILLNGIITVLAIVFLVIACGKDKFILTAIPNDPSYGRVSGGGEYKNGDMATLEAVPYDGYWFEKWSDDMTENPRTIIVHSNTQLTAIFSNAKNYTIDVYSNNNSWGTVSGGGTYPSGSKVTLKATPQNGYSFERWNDGNTNATRTITVTGNATYTAYFKSNSNNYTITVNSNNSSWGYVSGGGTFAYGTTTTIKATPYSGYSFDKWSDGSTSATRTITVTGNATYTAYFKTSGGGGGNASMSVNFGGTTWTASDYIGTYWSDDGVYVIGGYSASNYPWFRMQLSNISTGTYYATHDTTRSFYWLNNTINIVQYYENHSLVLGESTYQYGDWQGWNLTVTITSLTSSTISFTITGTMYNAAEATCSSCEEYVGSYAGASKRYITIYAYNIPFTAQSKGYPIMKDEQVLGMSDNPMESVFHE